MSDDQPYSVGAELARARGAAGMTTSQVSDATRIRRTIIEAIEHDDLGPSGGTAYARGHVKSICGVLGIESAPLLSRLGAPTVAETSPHVVSGEQPARDTAPTRSLGGALTSVVGGGVARERRGANWSAVMAGALVLVVAVGAVQFVRSTSNSPGSQVAGPTTTPTNSAPVTALPPSTPAPPPSSPAEVPPPDAIAQADTVNVVLTVTGNASWISATTPKGTLFEGTLTKGDRKTFKDRKKISFIFGNAGNVGLRVNGVDVGAPGNAGQVVRATFGPGDPGQAQA